MEIINIFVHVRYRDWRPFFQMRQKEWLFKVEPEGIRSLSFFSHSLMTAIPYERQESIKFLVYCLSVCLSHSPTHSLSYSRIFSFSRFLSLSLSPAFFLFLISLSLSFTHTRARAFSLPLSLSLSLSSTSFLLSPFPHFLSLSPFHSFIFSQFASLIVLSFSLSLSPSLSPSLSLSLSLCISFTLSCLVFLSFSLAQFLILSLFLSL